MVVRIIFLKGQAKPMNEIKRGLRVGVSYDAGQLAGFPDEYAPRVALWSTHQDRMPDATDGMAAVVLNMREDGEGIWRTTERAQVASAGDALPIETDPVSECCIIVQAATLSDGHKVHLDRADSPFYIRVGQINLPWYSVLRAMQKRGRSRASISVPVESMCGFESAIGKLQVTERRRHPSLSDEDVLHMTLQEASQEASRGNLVIHVDCDAGIQAIGQAVESSRRTMPSGMSPAKYLRMAEAELTAGLKTYQRRYDDMFPVEAGRPFVRYPEGQYQGTRALGYRADAPLVFRPDTANMTRFHLPMWATGGRDHLPFAEWWLTANAKPRASCCDESTEAFFLAQARAGLVQADLTEDEAIATLQAAFGPQASASERATMADKSRPEYVRFVRALEAAHYMVTALQVTCDYVTDGRYLSVGNRGGHHAVRIQVEAPERDAVSGLASAMDCEDDETTCAVQARLFDEALEGRWSHPLLSAMRLALHHTVPMHTFGSVRGAQISDAKSASFLHSEGRTGDGKTKEKKKKEDALVFNDDNKDDDMHDAREADDIRERAELRSLLVESDPTNHRLQGWDRLRAEHPQAASVLQMLLDADQGQWQKAFEAAMPQSSRDIIWEQFFVKLIKYLYEREALVLHRRLLEKYPKLDSISYAYAENEDEKRDQVVLKWAHRKAEVRDTSDILQEAGFGRGPTAAVPIGAWVTLESPAADRVQHGDPFWGDYTDYFLWPTDEDLALLWLMYAAATYYRTQDFNNGVQPLSVKKNGELALVNVDPDTLRQWLAAWEEEQARLLYTPETDAQDLTNYDPFLSMAYDPHTTVPSYSAWKVNAQPLAHDIHLSDCIYAGDCDNVDAAGLMAFDDTSDMSDSSSCSYTSSSESDSGDEADGDGLAALMERPELTRLTPAVREAITSTPSVTALQKTIMVMGANNVVRQYATRHPDQFWAAHIAAHHTLWAERLELGKELVRAHGLESFAEQHLETRKRQYGRGVVARHLARWVEWFDHHVRPTSLVHDWLQAPDQMTRHKLLARFLDADAVHLPISQRRPAKRILKSLLTHCTLAVCHGVGESAQYANRFYHYLVKAYGALAYAPEVLKCAPGQEEPHLRQLQTSKTHGAVGALPMSAKAATRMLRQLVAELRSFVAKNKDAQAAFDKHVTGWIMVYDMARSRFAILLHNKVNGECACAKPLSRNKRLAFTSVVARWLPPKAGQIVMALEYARSKDQTDTVALRQLASRIAERNPGSDGRALCQLQVSGMHVTAAPEWETAAGAWVVSGNYMGHTLDASHRQLVADFSNGVVSHMPRTLFSNAKLLAMEREQPLAFWMAVLRARAPVLHATLKRFCQHADGTANDAFLDMLPSADAPHWMEAFMWLAFYLKTLVEHHIAPGRLDMETRYVLLDFDRLFDRQLARVVPVVDALRDNGYHLDADGLFYQEDYDPERAANGNAKVARRLYAIQHAMLGLFDQDGRKLAGLRTMLSRTAKLLVGKEAMMPPDVDRYVSSDGATEAAMMSASETDACGPAVYSGARSEQCAADPDEDPMFIDSKADQQAHIGGHMFTLFLPYTHIARMYERSPQIMNQIYGQRQVDDRPDVALFRHIDNMARAMCRPNATDQDVQAARALLEAMPPMLGEGTGREEVLIHALDRYFDAGSQEIVRRTASHLASVHLAQAWHEAHGETVPSADVYGFQAHIYATSMDKEGHDGMRLFRRRLSPFYRRIGHSCSERLLAIHPDFRHLVWVRPKQQTFGANFRNVLEGDDALPIPAPRALSEAYLDTPLKRAALELRARRIAPVSLTFKGESAEPAFSVQPFYKESKTVLSAASTKFSFSAEPFEQWESLLCSGAESSSLDGLEEPSAPKNMVVFTVPRDSRLAETLRIASGSSSSSIYVVHAARGICYINAPRKGEFEPIYKEHFEPLTQCSQNLRVTQQHFMPHTRRTLCVEGWMPVVFHIQ